MNSVKLPTINRDSVTKYSRSFSLIRRKAEEYLSGTKTFFIFATDFVSTLPEEQTDTKLPTTQNAHSPIRSKYHFAT